MHKWRFAATEVDAESVKFARANIAANGLEALVQVRQVSGKSVLRDGIEPGDFFDFTMCNPPFFESAEGRAFRADRNSAITDSELVTTGVPPH